MLGNPELTYENARRHPAYRGALAYAERRAASDPGERFVIYYDGVAIYVRTCEAAPPPKSIRVETVCKFINHVTRREP